MKTVTLKLNKYEYNLLITQLNQPLCSTECYHERVTGHKVNKGNSCDNCPMYAAIAHIKQMLEK